MSLTGNQKRCLLKAIRATERGEWVRSEHHGERVTFASLHGRQLLVRRAWRGEAGEADAAYEYQAHPKVMEEWRK
jgi:hypothetical protein